MAATSSSDSQQQLQSSSQTPSVARQVVQRWTAAWGSSDPSEMTRLYKPKTGTYIDHSFSIRRTGHATITKHHNIWKNTNPDYQMTIVSYEPEYPYSANPDVGFEAEDRGQQLESWKKISIRVIGSGTFTRDLLRKKLVEGPPKKFEHQLSIDFVIDEADGLIVRNNEYYSYAFDAVETLADYNVVSDESAATKL